ncbi:MAG TPA: tetratricopeptide repeat protein, partial [Pyrinomonadaceae bacterium]|nr:tetratricopeptide repeat protein [Pyrinomonadaceae bacterium]
QSSVAVDAVAGRASLANWRQSIHPLESSWWWNLDTQAAAVEPGHNPLWTIPAAILFALSLSVLADTITTLRSGGINGLTVFGTLMQSLLALLAGSAFLAGGREWLEKLFAQLRINRTFQGASRVWLALGVLVLTFGLRILLPDLVARYHNRKGDAAFNNRQMPAAVLNYQQAVALKPSFVKAHFNLAVAYDKSHDYSKAIEEYQRSIDFDQQNFVAYNNLARLLILQQKDYNGALRRLDYLRQNLMQVPDNIQYYLFKNRGWANLELKNYSQAEADLVWSLIKRDGAAAHYLLGRVFEEEGRKAEAKQQWDGFVRSLQNDSQAEEEVEPNWIAHAQEQLTKGG